jgi:hypothetical protein
MQSALQIAQFPSKATTAGIVHVELGFVPDAVILISSIAATSPDVYIWVNTAVLGDWTEALSLKITGTTGVITRDTTGMAAYLGGDTVASAETDDTAGKHVTVQGDPAAAGHITAEGISIPADHQIDNATAPLNFLIAFRRIG